MGERIDWIRYPLGYEEVNKEEEAEFISFES